MPPLRLCHEVQPMKKEQLQYPPLPPAVTGRLLDWYSTHRRDLPWRESADPYRVWVSEIMLQQTRVAAVLPYYRRWMEALPDVAALAAVEEDRLMKLWEGLGYYSRARNLQRAAKVVMENHGGRFPDTFEGLRALPGIGDYTAGAVASIAFHRPVPAVDGNVLRITARLAALGEDILSPGGRRLFTDMVAELVPPDRPGDFNQALMDLGATVCLPNGQPDCGACPLAALCAAHAAGRETDFPVKRKKQTRRREEMTVYLLLREGRIALRRREARGLLAGLWEFPHIPGTLTEEEAAGPLDRWGLTPLQWRQRITARHIFTHVEWHMTGYLLEVRGTGADFTWADPAALETLAVPSAFAKYLEAAKAALAQRRPASSPS